MVRRLPDGSWLKIVAVSYSHTHSYSMPAPNAWQSFLLKHLPSSWTTQLRLWTGSGSVGMTAREGETNLVIFTVCNQATPTSARARMRASPQIEMLDEQGRKLGSASSGSTSIESNGKHQRRLEGWMFASPASGLPHDTKKLILHFSELGADGTRRQLAEFTIANPAATGN